MSVNDKKSFPSSVAAPQRMKTACAVLLGGFLTAAAFAEPFDLPDLARLTPGRTKAENALWIENPLTSQFRTSKRVVVAQINGPAMITMMHFAYGESAVSAAHKRLNRDLLLRIYWDGEAAPSVDCPLVDFFCDPDGTRDVVNTAFVNVRRGFNAYFPMPFKKSARIELVYEGPLEPGVSCGARCPVIPTSCIARRTKSPLTPAISMPVGDSRR